MTPPLERITRELVEHNLNPHTGESVLKFLIHISSRAIYTINDNKTCRDIITELEKQGITDPLVPAYICIEKRHEQYFATGILTGVSGREMGANKRHSPANLCTARDQLVQLIYKSTSIIYAIKQDVIMTKYAGAA